MCSASCLLIPLVISNGVHDFVSLIKLLLLTLDLPRGFFPFLPVLGMKHGQGRARLGLGTGHGVPGAASSAVPARCRSLGSPGAALGHQRSWWHWHRGQR